MTQHVREEPLEDVAYLHDGTLEGLLSCVFKAYERHEHPTDIVAEPSFRPRLGQSSIHVETDFSRAERVKAGLDRACGRAAFGAVLRASACDDYGTGMVVYRFIRYAMARPAELRGAPVLDESANPVVSDLLRLARRAGNEAEKMRQFIRFSHLEDGLWFARCNPNASVVPLVMGHFAARLNDQPFVIFDENHDLAGVYDGRGWQLVRGRPAEIASSTEHDNLMEEAWRRFYGALSVEARYNPELRRQFMPARLWQNLPELSPSSSPRVFRRFAFQGSSDIICAGGFESASDAERRKRGASHRGA